MKEDKFSLSISISGIINWYKDRKIKKDLNNIKSYENFILQEEKDQNGEETKTER